MANSAVGGVSGGQAFARIRYTVAGIVYLQAKGFVGALACKSISAMSKVAAQLPTYTIYKLLFVSSRSAGYFMSANGPADLC